MKKIFLLLFISTVHASTDLEKKYWDCDYAAITSMLNQSDAAICSEIFENLKKEKFNDSWQEFYSWWIKNKQHQYNLRKQ